MTDEEIVKVINTLVGSITPIADSYYDTKKKLNIQKLGYIIESLIYQLGNMSSEKYDSPYFSEKECGEEGIKILESIKGIVEDFLDECK